MTAIVRHGLEVAIPTFEEGQDAGGSFINYLVDVKKEGLQWTVKKRFSELHFFFTNVQENCVHMTSQFPAKSVGRLNAEALELRRAGLEDWLREFVTALEKSVVVLAQLNSFLQVENHVASSSSSSSSSNKIDIRTRINLGRVIKAGYLRKLGGNKQGGSGNWKRRYVVLQDDVRYYENEQSYLQGAPPKGYVKLSTYYVTIGEGENLSNEFTIHSLPFPLTCTAESREEMASWVETLRQFPDMI